MTDPEPTRIALVLVLLLGGGVTLNYWVDRADQRGLNHYAWAFVVLGVAGTLALSTLLVPLGWVLWVLGCFAASGTPMIVGALVRHERKVATEKAEAKRKQDELEAKLLELHGANQTAPLGE